MTFLEARIARPEWLGREWRETDTENCPAPMLSLGKYREAELLVQVYVDAADAEERDDPASPRFTVFVVRRGENEESRKLWEGDNEDTARLWATAADTARRVICFDGEFFSRQAAEMWVYVLRLGVNSIRHGMILSIFEECLRLINAKKD